jgi:hypothetical protein
VFSKFSGMAIAAVFWTLWAGAQTHGPVQPGAPGYSSSSWGTQVFEPENGMLEKGGYTNKYFDFAFPLPPEWREDYQGPLPSAAGYYVLEGLRPKGELNGTVLIAAHDTFFLFPSLNDSMALLRHRQEQAIASTLKIEAPPGPTKLAGHEFARLDYSGAGLYHAIFATGVRCHVITFEVTTRDLAVLESVLRSMNSLSLPAMPDTTGGVPRCVKDYATGANVLHRVDPVQIGPKLTKVPVRIIIDTEGKVKHIHVINAFPQQAKSVQDALSQWTFKPFLVDGRAVEVETGVLFEFFPRNKDPKGLKASLPKEGAQ